MVFESVAGVYSGLVARLPENYQLIPQLLIFAVLISLYGLFVLFFYKFMAKRDIVELNLSKYNKFNHPTMLKFFAIILYIVEFIFVIPLSITCWFAVLAIMLLFLAKEQSIQTIILVSAALVGSIRITSYFTEDLSKDLAKMIPFTLLGVVLLQANFFDFSGTLAKITQIPTLLSAIFYSAVFIIIIEVVFRFGYGIYSLASGKKSSKEEKK